MSSYTPKSKIFKYRKLDYKVGKTWKQWWRSLNALLTANVFACYAGLLQYNDTPVSILDETS